MPLFAGLHGDRRLISPAVRRTRMLPFPLRSLSEAPSATSILPPRPSVNLDGRRAPYLFRSRLLRGQAWIQRRRPRLQRHQETRYSERQITEWRIPEKQPGCDYSEPRKSAWTALPQLDVCLFLPVGSASWRRPAFSVFLPFWGLTEAGSTQVSLGFSSTKA